MDDENAKFSHSKSRSRHRQPSKWKASIAIGTILMGKYELKEIIGAGGYGQIYRAKCAEKDREVAVKVLPTEREPKRFILEQQILRELKGKLSFPEIFGAGTHDGMMFIVMECLGRSLSELRKRCSKKRFCPVTAIRCGIQMMDSLKMLHRKGFIHRDVKPGNMCIGASAPRYSTIYLLDFGLARRFKDSNGKLLKKRPRAGFRGTLRYVSLNVHEKRDQTPCEDLISLFYSIVELSEGSLPWTKLRDSMEIARKKKTTEPTELSKSQPPELMEFYEYAYESCEDMNYPNYEQLTEILKKCLPQPFDDAMPMSYVVALEERPPNTPKTSNETTIVEMVDKEDPQTP